MVETPSRLGRGLGALLAPRPMPVPDDPTDHNGARREGEHTPEVGPAAGVAAGSLDGAVGALYREVPVEALRPNPRQPRSVFDDDALAELAASIGQVGLLQPIVVREVAAGQYEIVMGERRWRAAAAAGLATVPVLVRETEPDALLRDALLENLHRADLHALDEAAAYAQLLGDFGATHEQLATRLGRSRAHITNTLRLMQLPAAVQRRLAAGVLSAGHARAILAVSGVEAQERLAARVVAEGLSVRAVEEIAAVGTEASPVRRAGRARTARPEFPEVAEALTERWETRVLVQSGRTKGRLVVEFGSITDLDRILGIVAPDLRPALGISANPGTSARPDPAASPVTPRGEAGTATAGTSTESERSG